MSISATIPRYAASVLLMAAALACAIVLAPLTHGIFLFGLLLLAQLVSVWLLGAGPSFLAAVAGAAGIVWSFGNVEHRFSIFDQTNQIGLSAYALGSVILCAVAVVEYRFRSRLTTALIRADLAEDRARLAQEASAQAIEINNRFLTSLAQELRTPLAPLTSRLMLLDSATPTMETPALDPAPSVFESLPQFTPPLAGVSLLLVEDDTSLETLGRALSNQGAEVRGVRCGGAALRLLARWSPDAIVAAIATLQDSASFLAQARIIMRGRQRFMPVFALTDRGHPREAGVAIAAGFQMHLAKPVDEAVLTAAVLSLLYWAKPSRGRR